jgi:uncharacterized protein DUF1353
VKQTIVVLMIAALLSACASHRRVEKAERIRRSESWGHFSGPVDTRWDNDGLDMTLLTEVRYTDPDGVVWVAPVGSKINGASIPRAFWSLVGGPFDGKYRAASVLHDVAYEQQTRPWQQVDRMFYNALRCSGVGVIEAKTMYYALYRHGHHWKHPVRRAIAAQPSDITPRAERATAVDPGEADAIQEWIENNDPSLDQIETRAAVAKH